MGFATNKKFFALTLASMLMTGYAGMASSMQAMQPMQPENPIPPPPPGPTPVAEAPSYFSRHFSTDTLGNDVKNAVIQANLAPVSFNKITIHTRDQVTSSGQSSPSTYTVAIVMENGGQGLIRRLQSVQNNNGNTMTRFDLTYRGYFPFLTQSVPANANALPPVVEARKVMHFDTHTDGHINFTYLYGATGQATFADPGQVICDSGKRYSASELNPAIQGEALELNCQNVDTNGIVTDKMTLAYLEKYGVSLMIHTKNPESSLDSTVVDFTAE
jgi:hypothetical protein